MLLTSFLYRAFLHWYFFELRDLGMRRWIIPPGPSCHDVSVSRSR
uniref:Uncharacterized protein n=1 Tax=Aegilops tauschii subsp. strangulata TaxID=200361 RepID=A0A453CFR2_AEGTS